MKSILILLFCIPFSAIGQSGLTLSADAEISVITCGPGPLELYSAFGHSAMRVHDPKNGIDLAFNYGVFNFNQPNFYLNFAHGYLYYRLGVEHYDEFEYRYIYFNRYVHEQVLNLTTAQKQKIFDYLQWNALPENVTYRYDYFYNNCATKMPDVILKALGDDVKFDGSHIKTEYSIRDLTDIYLDKQPWGDLGIDICLGLPMDKKAAPFEYMFLPDYVEAGFDNAVVKHGDTFVDLVKEKRIIYETRDEQDPKRLPHPLLVFSIFAALAIVLTILDFKKKRLSNWFDLMLFSVTGSIGLLLLVLWLFTDHNAAAKNFNILWALPTHLITVFAFIKNPHWLKRYFGVTLIIYLLLIVTWPVLPQRLHYALIPIVITLALRSYTQYKLRTKNNR